jgi:hypothetical protein
MPHVLPFSYYKGSLSHWDCLHQRKDIFRIMLPIGIDRDGPVREPENCGKSCKQRSSFTLVLLMVYHCYARKGSEDIGSRVCRSIIHHNHRQPELETFLDNLPYLCPMVISRNNNGTAKRYRHKIEKPEIMVLTQATTDYYIENAHRLCQESLLIFLA